MDKYLISSSGAGGGSSGPEKGKRKAETVAMEPKKKKKNTATVDMGVGGAEKALSKTTLELLTITPEMGRASLQRLIEGWIPDPLSPNFQPNSKGWAPAVVSSDGCILVQKSPSVGSPR